MLSQTPLSKPQCRAHNRNDACLELHAKLCDAALCEEATAALDGLVKLVLAHSFLNVRHVVKGGAVGKGLAIPGAADAQVVAFVDGLPAVGQEVFLPSLAQSLASVLKDQLPGQSGITEVFSSGDAVHLRVDGPVTELQLFVSPDFGSYTEALEALGSDDQKSRTASAAALMEQRVRFTQRLPRGAKAAIRLLKWWRQQRVWSSSATRPSDELLELIVAHVVRTRVPEDLHAAIEQVLEALSHFNDLKITWTSPARCYRDADVRKSLLEERPLVMDPVDALANLADPHGFQPDEMMRYARSGTFFA